MAVDLARLIASVDEHEPRVLDLMDPEEAARHREAGRRVYRVLTRVSDDKLMSIPQQIRECCAYAAGDDVAGTRRADADETAAVVDRVYNFGEQSGFTLFESRLFQQLLQDAQTGAFDGFIARDSSRLGRDYWDKFATLGLLRRSGKELHILEDGGRFDYDDDMTKVRSWADTWSDSKKKMEEIKKSMRATEALRSDGFPTTSVPFGYEPAWHPSLRRRVWRPSDDAEKVRYLFQEASSGTPFTIAELAREVGISRQLASKVLRNPVYTGGFWWGGAFVRADGDVVPPLVTQDVFDTVQEVLGNRNSTPASPKLRD